MERQQRVKRPVTEAIRRAVAAYREEHPQAKHWRKEPYSPRRKVPILEKLAQANSGKGL